LKEEARRLLIDGDDEEGGEEEGDRTTGPVGRRNQSESRYGLIRLGSIKPG
jgi:hypothetical protein